MGLTKREKVMVLLIVILLILLLVLLCGEGGSPTATALPGTEAAGVFNPVKIAEKGSISIYLVNGGVPCVVYRYRGVYRADASGGIDCDFSQGNILEGLQP